MFVFAGRSRLGLRGHGVGPAVPVDLHNRVYRGNVRHPVRGARPVRRHQTHRHGIVIGGAAAVLAGPGVLVAKQQSRAYLSDGQGVRGDCSPNPYYIPNVLNVVRKNVGFRKQMSAWFLALSILRRKESSLRGFERSRAL